MFWELEGWLLDQMHMMDCGMIVLDLLENRDHRHCQKAVNRLYKGRHFQKLNQKMHMAKFRAATFENDRRSIKPPHTADKEILPIVIDLLRFTLAREYRMRTGNDFADVFGLKALTGAAAFPKPVLYQEESAAGLERVFEQRQFASDEWLGLQLPEGVAIKAIDVRLGSVAAREACALEVSADGESWQAVPKVARSEGRLLAQTVPAGNWNRVRVRNISGKTVDVKLNLFRVDVTGPVNPFDALLEALVDK